MYHLRQDKSKLCVDRDFSAVFVQHSVRNDQGSSKLGRSPGGDGL